MAGRRVRALLALPCTAVALLAGGAGASAAGAAGATFVAVPASALPHASPTAAGTYNGAACPSARVCIAVGTSQGEAVLTMTRDGGVTWASTVFAEASSLAAIACPTAVRCYAGGEGPGVPWLLRIDLHATSPAFSPLPDPPASMVVGTIACASATACMVTGTQNGTAGPLYRTNDGGSTWSAGTSPGFVNELSCVGAGQCWAAGGGVWRSGDLGASWSSIPPPEPACPGACEGTWSDLLGLAFQSPRDGYLVGGDQCGQSTTSAQCPGVLFHTNDAGTTWTLWPASTNHAFGSQVQCSAAGCLYLTRTSSTSPLFQGTGDAWAPVQTLPGSGFMSLACTPSGDLCVATGSVDAQVALYERSAHGASAPSSGETNGTPAGAGAGTGSGGGGVVSSVALAAATPAQLAGAPLTTLLDALVVLALVLFITFPAHLFNRTYEENHTAIRAWWERRIPLVRTLREREHTAFHVRARGALTFVVVIIAGGVLGALLDPRFGLNGRTVGLVLGFMTAIAIGVTVSGSVGVMYRLRHRLPVRWHLGALPSGLLVAAACVVVSRLLSFQPGYLYGIIGGVVFAQQLDRRDAGRELAVTATATLLLSVLAWFVWVPVSTVHSPNFGAAFVQDLLTGLVVTGLVGLTISLVPLRFLPGERIAAWHRGAWAALFAVTLLALLELMLRPQSAHAHVDGAPFWTTLGLFLAFGAASVAFWGYFRVRTATAS